MTVGDPMHLLKGLCVKLKKLTSEVLKSAKSKCEIEINELKIEDGEGEHDLEIDGTTVKMKTAFIKIKNRSTLSLTDLDDQEIEEAEVSLEESLDKILSEESIPSIGEGWRKEVIRKSPHEAVIVCVKTPDNVELRSVGEAEIYLNSVGVTNVDVEKLFTSPPTPSKSLNNEVIEHEVVKDWTAVKELSEIPDILDSSTVNPNFGKGESESSESDCGKNEDLTNVGEEILQAVSAVVEPDSSSDKVSATTTTDSLDTARVSDGDTNMTEKAVGDINDNRVEEEKNPSPSNRTLESKKRKLVQTNMLAFLGQGQQRKKVKLNEEDDTIEETKELPIEIEITGNVLNGDQQILEKVTDAPLQMLDDNSNIHESDNKCLSENKDISLEKVVPYELNEVLEKVPEELEVPTADKSHVVNELRTADIAGVESGSPEPTEEQDHGGTKLQVVEIESGYLQCNFCDYETKNNPDMKKHGIKTHPNDYRLPQNGSNSGLSHNLELADESETSCRQTKTNSSKTNDLTCTECDLAFKVADSFENHNFYLHGDGTELEFEVDDDGCYHCDYCEYKTAGQKISNIKSHVYRKHWRKKEKKKKEDVDADIPAANKVVSDTVSNASPDEQTDDVSEFEDNFVHLESSDLPEGWRRFKVPRKAVGKFDTYVQNPDGRRFNCQKKIDVFIATNRLKLKGIKFNYPGPSSGKEVPSSSKEAKIKSKKQPCKESNNIPSEVSKKPIIPSKKKKDSKELDKENKAEKKQREKKPKTEKTDMCVTDKEIDESEENDELTENELQYITEIDQFMKETKLNLEPKPATKGDGNCWYRAAACQVILHEIADKPKNHKSMRLEVSNHLKNLPAQIKEDTINVVYLGRARGLTDLASRQRKAGQWVDNMGVMVLATAHYLGRNIHLYGYPTSSESQSRLFSLTRIEGGDQADKFAPLTIFYHDRHYQTLQPAVPASLE